MSPDEHPDLHEFPLRPIEFQILLVLAEGDSHGYGIIQATEERTGGKVKLRPGTLYRAMQRLEDAGLIRESERRPAPEVDDRRRRYFGLTPEGRRMASEEARRLADLVEAARHAGLLEAAR